MSRYNSSFGVDVPSIDGVDLPIERKELIDWDPDYRKKFSTAVKLDHGAFVAAAAYDRDYRDVLQAQGIRFEVRELSGVATGSVHLLVPVEISYDSPRTCKRTWAYQFTFTGIDDFSCEVIFFSQPLTDAEAVRLFEQHRNEQREKGDEAIRSRSRYEEENDCVGWALLNAMWTLGELALECRLKSLSEDDVRARLKTWGIMTYRRGNERPGTAFLRSFRKYAELCPEALVERARIALTK